MGDLYRWDKTLIEGLDAVDPASASLDQSRIGPVLVGDAKDLGDGPPVTALLIQNTNPMAVAPELGKVHEGFARDDLFVCVHEQFLTETARMADIVLPATMFLEHDDIYQASAHPRIQIARKLFEPHAECRPNHWVIGELARRLGAEHPGFAMSEWALIDDLLTRSGWPDAETVWRGGRLGYPAELRAGASSGRLPDAGRPLPLQAGLGLAGRRSRADAPAAGPYGRDRRGDTRAALPAGRGAVAPVPQHQLHRDAHLTGT